MVGAMIAATGVILTGGGDCVCGVFASPELGGGGLAASKARLWARAFALNLLFLINLLLSYIAPLIATTLNKRAVGIHKLNC